MNVSKLLHELLIIPDVEVVIALLPEMLGSPIKTLGWPTQACFWLEWETLKQPPRDSLLQRFQRICQRLALRFAQ